MKACMQSYYIIGALLGLSLRAHSTKAFLNPSTVSNHRIVSATIPSFGSRMASSTGSSLNMVRNRGLERPEEGATPLPGGMTLYVKPAADGTSVGDCPFAHFVRMVLTEKSLPYDLQPTAKDAKPQWLVDYYEGKMPALRHRKECYVESDVIANYLEFFFQEPSLTASDDAANSAAEEAIDGFFPAVAKFLKHRPNGDEDDKELQANLEAKLQTLEDHLSGSGRTGPYLVGDGEQFTLLDCSMAPKLYAMDVCLERTKENPIDLKGKYPNVRKYMDDLFDRPSFKSTSEYGPETLVWGWTSHL